MIRITVWRADGAEHSHDDADGEIDWVVRDGVLRVTRRLRTTPWSVITWGYPLTSVRDWRVEISNPNPTPASMADP